MLRAPRVCLGLMEIAGYYGNLQRGFDAIRVPCDFLSLAPHRFGYSHREPRSPDLRALLWMARLWRPGLPRTTVRGSINQLLLGVHLLSRLLIFARIAFAYDVFVFAGGFTFFRQFDAWLLRRLGKSVIVVFHGSDSRPPFLSGRFVPFGDPQKPESLRRVTQRVFAHVQRCERSATVCVDNPLSGQFHQRPFVNWFEIGLPMCGPNNTLSPAAREEPARRLKFSEGPIRVLHAPSDLENKGTQNIRRAVGRLRGRGIQIDLVEVVNRKHSDVLHDIESCDFVVDELYSDAPGAGLATEAAWLGRPSLVCGYAADEFDRFIRLERRLPVHYVHPDLLETAMEQLATDAEYRENLGAQACRFVHEVSVCSAVAERLLRVAIGGAPADWIVRPQEIRYVNGWGLNERRLAAGVRSILTAFGAQALRLDDKPVLRDRLTRLAMSPDVSELHR